MGILQCLRYLVSCFYDIRASIVGLDCNRASVGEEMMIIYQDRALCLPTQGVWSEGAATASRAEGIRQTHMNTQIHTL